MRIETIQAMAGAAVLSSFTYVPILAKSYLGEGEFYISLIVTVYATASFISSYVFGRAGDIFGRRVVLHAGLFISTISFVLVSVAYSAEFLLIIRALNGFSVGIYPGALAAYAYETDMPMGRFASFGAIGWGFGTILAGFAAGFDIRAAFWITGVFFMIAFISAMGLPEIQRERINVPLFPLETIKRNLPVYAAVLIRHSSAFAIWTYWPLFLAALGADLLMIGVIQAMNSIAQVVFMIGITDRFQCERLIVMGLVTSAITFLWFAVVTDFIQILPTQILLGFSWACLYVGALKYVTERNEERATASGLLTSVMSISGMIGPIIAAAYFTIWPSYLPIILNAVVMSLVALVIFWVSSKRLDSYLEMPAC
ncbi:MAG: MFS transporter [Candidatus Thorarchaeota archaeon]|nr:MAG: MFS transporter [Candidatus Thorarchaeota archaeon]